MRGLINRYAVVSLQDPAAVTRRVRKLRERTGQECGTYVIAVRPPDIRQSDFLRMLLTGSMPVVYVGESVRLQTRVPTIARGVCGQPSRHGLVKRMADCDPPLAMDDLVAIMIPFSWHDSLEAFLLEEHIRVVGSLPVGNLRKPGRSNATNRPPRIKLTWDGLAGGQTLEASA